MKDYTNYGAARTKTLESEDSLRAYMLSIYNHMTFALFITGIVAYFSAQSETIIRMLFSVSADGSYSGISGIGLIITLAPVVLVFALSAKINTMKLETARTLFLAYAVLMGLSLSTIFLAYSGQSIAACFFISASMFGAASIYGLTTKKDLTSFGSFLFMGVIGILIASVVNMFLHSSAIVFATSILGVIIFTGLAAYDNQVMKNMYFQLRSQDPAQLAKAAIMGALRLYMDFINIFIMILRLFGERK